MSVPTRRIIDPIFSKPVLRYSGAGMAGWCKENSLSQWQKGSGWTANLYGGAQSGDDWAAIFIPVNELPVTDFNSAQWSYYMTAAETMGVNIVIWIHDRTAFQKRAEVTQLANVSGLAKAQGWNAHDWSTSTTQMFFYGENTTGTGLTAGTQYTWAQFQADALFKFWTIYRISLEYGWEASGTFDDAWVADLKLNGERILLVPADGECAGGETKSVYVATATDSSARATAATPAAAKRIRIHSVFMNTGSSTATRFECYFHTGTNITSDGTKAIAAATLDADTNGSAFVAYGDNDGPVGGVGEVVSIRTGADITTNGNFTIVYHEE